MRSLIFITTTIVLSGCSLAFAQVGSTSPRGAPVISMTSPTNLRSANPTGGAGPISALGAIQLNLGVLGAIPGSTIGTIVTCPTIGIAARAEHYSRCKQRGGGHGDAVSADSPGRNAVRHLLLRHVNHDRRLRSGGSGAGRQRSFGQQRRFADTWSCYHHWTVIQRRYDSVRRHGSWWSGPKPRDRRPDAR